MNGFEWLDTLPPELHQRLEELMDAVAQGNNELVEAMTPALLDEAVTQELPWVEVFVRNFHLRSLVFNREDVRLALPQAVSLLERAHRDDTRECPQSVCASHVLTAAYTLTDPTGYAAKREAVSRETLEGLEPERICFVCISNEVAKALIDQGKAEEALTFLEQQRQTRLVRGIDLDPDDFARTEATALLALDRHPEALQVVAAGLESGTVYRGESWMNEVRQLEAWILAESGDGERALQQLPELQQVLRDGGFETHRRLIARLVEGEQLEPLPAAVRLAHLAGVALQRGLVDTGIQASVQATAWLRTGGHPTLADAVLQRALAHTAALVDPDRYRAAVDALPPPAEPDPSSIMALQSQPETAEHLQSIANRWRQMGFDDRAEATLQDATTRFPDDLGLYEARCSQALDRRDAEGMEALIAHPPDHPEGEDNARFYEGLFAHGSGDTARAIAAFEWVWARRQDWAEVAKRLGRLHLHADPARSLVVWEQAAEAHPGNYFRWMAMVAATAAADWPAQARLGRELELPELPDDRRSDLSWGYLRIRIPGDAHPFLAQRTGPVTARILSLRTPGQAQHHGEIVVFDPQSNNADEVAEDEDTLHVHDAWMGLEPASHATVTLDGIWPGEEAVEALTDALDQAEVYHQLAAGSGYEITDPDGGHTHRGLYLYLAVDEASGPALRALLEAHRPEQGPWTYHELLDRLGASVEADAQREQARAWGMIE